MLNLPEQIASSIMESIRKSQMIKQVLKLSSIRKWISLRSFKMLSLSDIFSVYNLWMSSIKLPTSSFLFLHKKGLTLKADDEEYVKMSRTIYKQEAFKFVYVCLLCKLYDIANLPAYRVKPMFYGPMVALVLTYSFYGAASRLSDFISGLNRKYDSQCFKFLSEEQTLGL